MQLSDKEIHSKSVDELPVCPSPSRTVRVRRNTRDKSDCSILMRICFLMFQIILKIFKGFYEI